MTEADPLLTTLRQAGLIPESPRTDPASQPAAPAPAPWFVQTLHAFSGWLASLFFLLMLGSLFHRLFDTPFALLGIGIGLIALAYPVLRAPSETLFLEHGALALSLAGEVLIGFALFGWNGHLHTLIRPFPWLILAGVEGALVIVIPHYLHRILAAWVAALALIWGAGLLGIGAVAVVSVLAFAVWIWLHEFRSPKTLPLKQAAGYGLSLALLAWSVGIDLPGELSPYQAVRLHLGLDHPAVIALLDSAVLLATVCSLVRRQEGETTLSPLVISLPLLPIVFLSVWMDGLPIVLTLLIVGFARGNRLLLGMSLAALILGVGKFYYTLETTLLVKSALLIATGAVLLIGYALLRYREGGHDAP